MALKSYNPVTPSTRQLVLVDRSELWKGKPVKALTEGKRKTGGRNNNGRITAWRKSGGHKQRYRVIDFKRRKFDVPATVERLEYDPNRTAFIALVKYADGEQVYILAPQRLKVGDQVVAGEKADIKPGNALQLKNIPVGTIVHNVELKPGKGGQMARSAGTFARLMAVDGEKAILALPSGEIRRVPQTCRATIGLVGRPDANTRNLGKAGRNRWLGVRPTVRGNAMNPIAHPLGGGEGHTNGGRQHCSPWALVEGKKTRTKKNRSNVHIIRRRDGRAMTTEA